MADKSSVSALHEYCAKNKLPKPTYIYIEEGETGFACEVSLMENSAVGSGRSKRDAKHVAAAQLNKKLRIDDAGGIPKNSDIDNAPTQPIADMITVLRDYCVQHDIPLPEMDIVQQAGTPDAPEFTAVCRVASLQRYGVSDKKKDAKQKAAWEMLQVVTDDINSLEQALQVTSFQNKQHEIEVERYRKFKTYRELTESKSNDVPGTLLQDRHNYFSKFYPELKEAAQKVLSSTEYECKKTQVLDLLAALKIKPKISMEPSATGEPLVCIELDCEYDVVFLQEEETIYEHILQYFKIML